MSNYVNTLHRIDEAIDLDMLHNLICYAIDDEQFVVLRRLNTLDYIQMAAMGQKFIVEYRHYLDEQNYQHYRYFVDEPAQAYPFFEQFYQQQAITLHHWADVSEQYRQYEQDE
ncbi:MAG: hypothetical protein Q4D05_00725 [Acinetobacter sp.]|nr:hypothetical protein [Acinetobacter sp.]